MISVDSTHLAAIEALICQSHGVTPLALRSRRQGKQLAEARRDFSKMARELGFSYPAIGKFMHRHHTSILNQVRDHGG